MLLLDFLRRNNNSLAQIVSPQSIVKSAYSIAKFKTYKAKNPQFKIPRFFLLLSNSMCKKISATPACIDGFIMNRLHWFLWRGRSIGSAQEHSYLTNRQKDIIIIEQIGEIFATNLKHLSGIRAEKISRFTKKYFRRMYRQSI